MTNLLTRLFKEATNQPVEDRNSYLDVANIIQSMPEGDYPYLLGAALAAKKVGNDNYALNILLIVFNHEGIKKQMRNPLTKEDAFLDVAKKVITTVANVNALLRLQKAYYDDRPIPAAMKRIMKTVLENAKSSDLIANLDKSSRLTLRDSIKLLHPKPKNAQMADLFVDIIRNRVKTGRLSESISSITRKYEAQEVQSNKVVKFIEQSPFETVVTLAIELASKDLLGDKNIMKAFEEVLLDEIRVEKEKVSPFQLFFAVDFVDLHEENENVRELLWCLKEAFTLAIENLSFPAGKTLYLVDTSDAMKETVPAGFYGLRTSQVAALIGAIALVEGKGEVWAFDDSVHEIKETTNDIFEIYEQIMNVERKDGLSNFKNALGEIAMKINSVYPYQNVIVLTNKDNYTANNQNFKISNNKSAHWRNRTKGIKDFRSTNDILNELILSKKIGQFFMVDVSGAKGQGDIIPAEVNYKVLLTCWNDHLNKIAKATKTMDDGFEARKLIEAFID